LIPLWAIPMVYVAASIALGFGLPRLELAYFPSSGFDISVASAQAYLSAVASGMMALTGIVFAMAFVMVQFSAIAYSPRLVLLFARDRVLFHSLGAFIGTFMYALFNLAWVDRAGSGSAPLISSAALGVMLIASMLLFTWLVQRLAALQIASVLRLVGDKGRDVIAEMFVPLGEAAAHGGASSSGWSEAKAGPPSQTLVYSGPPQTIAALDIASLVRHAEMSGGVVAMTCSVGEALLDGTAVLRVYGARRSLSERDLMRAIRLASERTFEQDPKYPIRLLGDIAIKALSPAINDPTTAVQAIDQIEDLMRRLALSHLDSGIVRDAQGVVRLVVPMPTFEDYLSLAFDEIRQFGIASVQVMRRLRAALNGLAEMTPTPDRIAVVRRYAAHLDRVIERSELDLEDRAVALQEDRQGLGLSRQHVHVAPASQGSGGEHVEPVP
jgi:uncharacterized membrane protein